MNSAPADSLPSNHSLDELNRVRGLYLRMMEKCLVNTIYEDRSNHPEAKEGFDSQARSKGLDWPVQAHSMIGSARMFHLRAMCEYVITHGVPGDFIETGVWRGGASIMMRAVLKAYGVNDRKVWVADSFAGMPVPDVGRYPSDTGANFYLFNSTLAISLAEVENNFSKYGLLDDQVRFLKGWFKDTLPAAPISRLALIRLDGDMYESTMDGLTSLYSKLSSGGIVIIDDYFLAYCQKAVHDFRDRMGIAEPIQRIDQSGAFWEKQ